MKLAVFTIAIAMCCLGCNKEVSDHSFEDSKNIPSIIQSSRSYSLDQLLELADIYENNLSGRSAVDLSPQDFNYALETKINRDFRAGSNQGSSRQSHLLFIDFELDSNGMIPSSQFESIENQITYQIDYLVSLGA
ncbi:hypothetical protein [Sanyastnella coralliicola]|uniref:hypothetical protein n=1 Tax=Sanyastnella coralliicola TaxID=3069118 RepID=UPI0027B97A0D|nr:hypothetical protein [Longitalea sp. SCSIO 12813]